MFTKTNNKKHKVRSLKGLFAGLLFIVLAFAVSGRAIANPAEAKQQFRDLLQILNHKNGSLYECSLTWLDTSGLGSYGYDPSLAENLKNDLASDFMTVASGTKDFNDFAKLVQNTATSETATGDYKYSCPNGQGIDWTPTLISDIKPIFNSSLSLFTQNSDTNKTVAITTVIAKPTPQECFEADLEDLMVNNGGLRPCYCDSVLMTCDTNLGDDIRNKFSYWFKIKSSSDDSSAFKAMVDVELSLRTGQDLQQNKYYCSGSDKEKAVNDLVAKFNECAIPLTSPSTSTGGTKWAPPVDQKTGTMLNVITTNGSSSVGNTPVGNASDQSNGLDNSGAASSGCSIGITTHAPGTSLAFVLFLVPLILFVGLKKSLISQEELADWLKDLA